jgi:hypothetical protein
VVRHLQHVGPQVEPGGHQLALGEQLGVAGQQYGARGGARPHDQRGVVHVGAVLVVDLGRRVHRTQHVHGERRPAQPLARAQRQDRRPVRLGDLAHVREGPAGERHRADGERPDGTPGQLRPVCCRHSLLV